ASQVQLGVQQQLIGSLYRFGPAGAVAGQSLGVIGGQFGLMSTGALAATAGIAAIGGAAVALTRRGIPQIKEFQTALRVMVADGQDLTASELDETLRRIQIE